MKKPIVIINGSGGVGKDTFVSLCNNFARCKNYSSVAGIKKVAEILGWNGAKEERDRKFLSDLKLLASDYSDFSYNCICNAIDDFYENNEEDIMFIHIRDIPEIKRVKRNFGAYTLLVINNNIPEISTNIADRDVKNYQYDYMINNSGSLADLNLNASRFIKSVLFGGNIND